MARFLSAHAMHPDWRKALALAAAQIDAGRALQEREGAGPLSLGLVYLTDVFAAQATAILTALQARWPGVHWVGCVGVGIAAGGVEYFAEPAIVLMLADLPSGRFEVFSGARPLHEIEPYTALVHADPETPDLGDLIVDMADRTSSGYLFGGIASSRAGTLHIADGIWHGGLSGVAFGADVALVSRVTQGCQPVGPERRVTKAERNIVLALDGEPALTCLLRDLGLATLDDSRAALPHLRGTLVGLADDRGTGNTMKRRGAFGDDVRVRNLVGLDPLREAVAVGERIEAGMRLSFCQRDVQAARRDLVRICAEIREEIEAPHELAASGVGEVQRGGRLIRGAIYVSCAGRGGPHFGGPSAEMKIVEHALGDVPLVGFFGSGEIARHHLYGYTGVLTVFTGEG